MTGKMNPEILLHPGWRRSGQSLLLFLRRRHLSTVVDLAHLSSPIDLDHLSSLRSPSDLLASYTVTPPVRPWPSPLTSRRLASLIRRQPSADLAFAAFRHAAMFVPNFSPSYLAYHALMDRLARDRAFHLIPPVLTELRRSGARCGEQAFITLIRAYSLASRPAAALRTFLSIPSFGVRASVRSFNALLNAMIQNRRYRLAAALFRRCRSRFGVIPNVCSCNILLKALCKMGDIDGALQVLDEMPGWGMVPNVITYTTIIAYYCAHGDLPAARALFDTILSRGYSPDATTYTVLIDGYCHHGELSDAVKTMDEMEAAGIPPNDVTYSVVIEACCKEKKSGEALNLLLDMLDGKYMPESSLCCKVIDALCEDGKVEDACEIWRRLLKKNVTPDNSISSTLIYWLCKKGKVWEARKLFDQFERGFIPSLLTYNTLISGMCENGELQEAGRLWDDMVERKCMPNVFTYNVLIKGFCKARKAKEGVMVLDEMFEKGCIPDKFTYSVLVDGLFESGDEEEVGKVLQRAASGRGKFLDVGCWDVFIRKVVSDTDRWREHIHAVLDT
ncbi:pentatricopeptide repeat-containing protein At5g16420, mitochondrial [Phoenix dactylifera]|uniref:Pentatricopeptide repeat-containing protein At5g16420, mitochondrial n=1 Tax=Phoenix dactylifera TaxID=42345 RepID=A0A8B7CTS1_PHODC|nr:pentatricopeptide repeat-containing protein At5g16420, mitochondrial [Phoenix dactylifera]